MSQTQSGQLSEARPATPHGLTTGARRAGGAWRGRGWLGCSAARPPQSHRLWAKRPAREQKALQRPLMCHPHLAPDPSSMGAPFGQNMNSISPMSTIRSLQAPRGESAARWAGVRAGAGCARQGTQRQSTPAAGLPRGALGSCCAAVCLTPAKQAARRPGHEVRRAEAAEQSTGEGTAGGAGDGGRQGQHPPQRAGQRAGLDERVLARQRTAHAVPGPAHGRIALRHVGGQLRQLVRVGRAV